MIDMRGRLVRTLRNGIFAAGHREVVRDGKDQQAIPASSGVYFYGLKAGNKVLTRKMVLLK